METFVFESTVLQVISYIITVVVGGVAYKWVTAWWQQKNKQNELSSDANSKLIAHMQERIDSIYDRVHELEAEKRELHERELARTRLLAKAEAQVTVLENRVSDLEAQVKTFVDQLKKYEKKYGPL